MGMGIQSSVVRAIAWTLAVVVLAGAFLLGRWTDSGGESRTEPARGVVITGDARVATCERALGVSNPGRYRFVWHGLDAQCAGVIYRIAALCDTVPSRAAQNCEAAGLSKLGYASSAKDFERVGQYCRTRFPQKGNRPRLPRRAPSTGPRSPPST